MPELVNLVNEHGRLQHAGVPRSELPRDIAGEGLYIEAVTIVLLSGANEIVVGQRASGKKTFPDHYDHICGALETGETVTEAAYREAYQEFGISHFTELMPVTAGVNVNQIYRHLRLGRSNDEPEIMRLKEVAAIHRLGRTALEAKLKLGWQFVPGFFDDLNLALALAA